MAATALVLGVWQHDSLAGVRWWLLVVALAFAALCPRRVLLVVAVVALLVGATLGARSWAALSPRSLGPFTGWARLAADPAPIGRGLRLTVEIEGQRFDTWVYGARARTMLDQQEGEWWWVSGSRVEGRRNPARHVVGGFRLDVAADVVDGSALSRASNRLRAAVRSAAERTMRPDDAALFTGLVLGDDARQPTWLVQRFRTCGLSHLTAVSGQNVAFVLAAAAPLLRRLRAWWRWAATVLLVAWFMAITRFEPSVLRAGVMAVLGATAFVSGATLSRGRLVGFTVCIVTLLDPLLVWSVGFWLSLGATCGLLFVTPFVARHAPGPQWLAGPLAVTVGAQAGVAIPSALVFGRLPLMAIPANLVAVPVAGAVMLVGLPVAAIAPILPGWAATVLLFPVEAGTRWVAAVAGVGAALEPSPIVAAVGWAVLVCVACVARAAAR